MAQDSDNLHFDKALEAVLRRGRSVRSIGVDDAPFRRGQTAPVGVAGVVCSETRFEGMLWDEVTADGDDATEVIAGRICASKFHAQLHVILLDGVAVGGFNVIDVPELSAKTGLPVIAIMREMPDFEAIEAALQNVSRPQERLATIRRAGPIHSTESLFFQSPGLSPALARVVLKRLTRHGHVPEPVRMAHLISGAIATGESGRRA